MKPSKYQQAVYDFIQSGRGNAVISAVAGSGKTTTIINALSMIPAGVSTLFLAFNKEIATELRSRIPMHKTWIQVSTVHSYGYRILRDNISDLKLDDSKHRKIFNEMAPELKIGMEPGTFKEFRSDVMYLVDLFRMYLVKDWDILMAEEVVRKHSLILVGSEIQASFMIIEKGRAIKDVIDYTDMIYLPNYYAESMRFNKYSWVFIDECQDLSIAQRMLMFRAIDEEEEGRFVAVGDPRQCIYGFAGADIDSFNELLRVKNTIQLPLSISYRCAQKIVDRAREIVPYIEARENAPEGEIVEGGFKVADMREGDMVLCRNTRPLVSLCFRLLSEGRKATIKGRDIGQSLTNLIESVEADSVGRLIMMLRAKLDKEADKIAKAYGLDREEALESEAYQSLNDRVQAVVQIAQKSESIPEALGKIKVMFSDDTVKGIQLSTVHRSKGLEADRVIIINPELMPSSWAKTPRDREQEANIIYVAYTRAKSLLAIGSDCDVDSRRDPISESFREEPVSEFVGEVGKNAELKVNIFEIKDITTKFGACKKILMKDSSGNVIIKLGLNSSNDRVLLNNLGKDVVMTASVHSHSKFGNSNETRVDRIHKIEVL